MPVEDTTGPIDLSQIADANLTDIEVQDSIDLAVATVDPILREFMKAAAEGKDLWLKKKSLKILAEWIMSLLDLGQVMQAKVEALEAACSAMDAELTELRPKKRKVWTPGIN